MFASKYKKPEGFVLLTSLLFLSILSMLAFSILEVSILETKMSVAYHDKIKSFYLAEEKLIKLEKIAQLGVAGVDLIKTDICGVDFYRVTSKDRFRNSKTVLCSVVAKTNETKSCNLKIGINIGRQSFAVLH